MGERLQIVPYDSRWVLDFETERDRIARTLGTLIRRVDHKGSTAVPGLDAKPIIDIQISMEGCCHSRRMQSRSRRWAMFTCPMSTIPSVRSFTDPVYGRTHTMFTWSNLADTKSAARWRSVITCATTGRRA